LTAALSPRDEPEAVVELRERVVARAREKRDERFVREIREMSRRRFARVAGVER
jgi:ribosomal protein L31E